MKSKPVIDDIPDEWFDEIDHQRSIRDEDFGPGPDFEAAEQFALQRAKEREQRTNPNPAA